MIVIVVAAVGVGSYFLLKGPGALPEQEELDFTVSGGWLEVCYIPFRTGADERWKLTIECLEMPSEMWVGILLYDEYWDRGTGHKCDLDDLYPLADELTQLQKIGVGQVYTGTYGTSTPQSFTVFFSFPEDVGKFHVKLEKVE